jgi:hypothetical protein
MIQRILRQIARPVGKTGSNQVGRPQGLLQLTGDLDAEVHYSRSAAIRELIDTGGYPRIEGSGQGGGGAGAGACMVT